MATPLSLASCRVASPTPSVTTIGGSTYKELKIPLLDAFSSNCNDLKKFLTQVELYLKFNSYKFRRGLEGQCKRVL